MVEISFYNILNVLVLILEQWFSNYGVPTSCSTLAPGCIRPGSHLLYIYSIVEMMEVHRTMELELKSSSYTANTFTFDTVLRTTASESDVCTH